MYAQKVHLEIIFAKFTAHAVRMAREIYAWLGYKKFKIVINNCVQGLWFVVVVCV